MKFKKLKYNVVCLILVLLMFGSLAVRVVFFDDSNQQVIPQIDQVVDEESPNAGASSNNTPSNKDDVEIYEKDDNLPSTRTPSKLINYCFDKVTKSSSYQTDIKYKTIIEVTALQATAVQTITGTSIKYNDKRLEEMTFEGDPLAIKFSPLYGLQTTYYDGTNYHRWKTDKGGFDITKANYTTTSKDNDAGFRFYYDFLNKDFKNTPDLTLDPASASISAHANIQNGTITVDVSLSDKENYPSNFLRTYNTFNENIKIDNLTQTITFTIDQKSGYIKRLYKIDKYYGKYSYKGLMVDVEMSLYYTQTFSKYNQEFIIKTPATP